MQDNIFSKKNCVVLSSTELSHITGGTQMISRGALYMQSKKQHADFGHGIVDGVKSVFIGG